MTIQEITDRVNKGADDRLGDTIGRVLETMKWKHTHQCGTKECSCEYCQFINLTYVKAKLEMHGIKKRIRIIDNDWWEERIDPRLNYKTSSRILEKLQIQFLNRKTSIRAFKEHKKELMENII